MVTKKGLLNGVVLFVSISYLLALCLSLNATGAGFNAFTIEDGILQVRQKPSDGRTHRVRAFYGAAVNFTADGAHSGHISSRKLKV